MRHVLDLIGRERRIRQHVEKLNPVKEPERYANTFAELAEVQGRLRELEEAGVVTWGGEKGWQLRG